MIPLLRLSVCIALATLAVGVGCGVGAEVEEGGDEQNLTTGACDVVNAITKKKLSPEELAQHKDPIAQKILLGDGCPENLDEISAKLERTDTANCSSDDGLTTRLVNDTAFLTGKADGAYRGVVTKDCDGRGRADFFMSVFGIQAGASKLPQEQTELIGFDNTSGVFNFYVRESDQNQWVFMGSSKDGISAGYECNEFGSCHPKAAESARCWACHEGGGLNMKELNSPWDSWDLNNRMPGRDDIFAKHGKQLGRPETGIDLEDRVGNGNSRWNKTRIEVLKEKGAAEVLRPLFCTLTINLQGGASTLFVPNFFVPDQFAQQFRSPTSSFLQMDEAIYRESLQAIGQQIVDRSKRPISGPSGPIVDTQTPFRYIEKGLIDFEYVFQLVDAGIIDDDFVKDVLSIDITRSVFSKTRCDLLSAAPKISGADLTPEKIREGFKTNLAGKSGAAAQLLEALSNTNDASAHDEVVANFFTACEKRPKKELMMDILTYLSSTRRMARAHKSSNGAGGIIEFAETLPIDKLPNTNKAFDPVTCTLK